MVKGDDGIVLAGEQRGLDVDEDDLGGDDEGGAEEGGDTAMTMSLAASVPVTSLTSVRPPSRISGR